MISRCSTPSKNRYADADPLYQRVLAIRKAALAPKHPDLATSLKNYAALLRQTGRSAEAEKLMAKAETILANQPDGEAAKPDR